MPLSHDEQAGLSVAIAAPVRKEAAINLSNRPEASRFAAELRPGAGRLKW